jgi:hypothetical protein
MLLMKGEMKREDLQVNTAVEDVLRILHSDLVHVESMRGQAAPDLPAVRGDRVQIQRVLEPRRERLRCDVVLPPAGARLLVSTQLDEGFVRVSVADRGQGIAREHAERSSSRSTPPRSMASDGPRDLPPHRFHMEAASGPRTTRAAGQSSTSPFRWQDRGSFERRAGRLHRR